ncbi:hypothetical protein, partial [Paenibacillus anseongensis]|uniref:hypothetical protein n=1 Tax=Paenibacillus TaxID=44249 RepID=UPI001C68336A
RQPPFGTFTLEMTPMLGVHRKGPCLGGWVPFFVAGLAGGILSENVEPKCCFEMLYTDSVAYVHPQ